MASKKNLHFEIRSGTVDVLHFVVGTADIDLLRGELARRFELAPEFFADDGVAIDLRRLGDAEKPDIGAMASLLAEFRMRPLGVVGSAAQRERLNAGTLSWVESRERRGAPGAETLGAAAPAVAAPTPAPAAPAPQQSAAAPVGTGPHDLVSAAEEAARADAQALGTAEGAAAKGVNTTVIDRPLRSGQRIHVSGDLVLLGVVSHGAEVIAQGNIYIYAPLRGRALAGVLGNLDARIFCTCLEPELISIAGVYRTAENRLPDDVLGKPGQVRLAQDKLIVEPLKLT
ncbi:MAG: septum site-determining protein MinC [Janthinobacterium lividum]